MIVTELLKHQADQTLVSVERSDVSDDEIRGFILRADDDLVVMSMYSSDGEYEGLTLFPTSQITEVAWGNRELKAIRHLIVDDVQNNTPYIEGIELGEIIEELSRKYECVALMENGDESYFDVARLASYDQEWLKLECYGNKRTLSKYTKLTRVDNISRVEFDTIYVQRILRLHKTDL
jgi:hypothetical protein